MNLRTAAALAVLGLALAACGGGGGGGGDTAANTGSNGNTGDNGGLNASTFQSVDAFIAYLRQLVATADDTGEPLALPDGAAPTSDTTEPAT